MLLSKVSIGPILNRRAFRREEEDGREGDGNSFLCDAVHSRKNSSPCCTRAQPAVDSIRFGGMLTPEAPSLPIAYSCRASTLSRSRPFGIAVCFE